MRLKIYICILIVVGCTTNLVFAEVTGVREGLAPEEYVQKMLVAEAEIYMQENPSPPTNQVIANPNRMICQYDGYGSLKSWELMFNGELRDTFTIYERPYRIIGTGAYVFSQSGMGIPAELTKLHDDITRYLQMQSGGGRDGFHTARLYRNCLNKKAEAIEKGKPVVVNRVTGEVTVGE